MNKIPKDNYKYAPAKHKVKSIQYFEISVVRLVIYSLVSFGIYQTYWIFKNWQAISKAIPEKIIPFWRTVFGLIFIYWLYGQAIKSAQAKGYKKGLSVGWLTLTTVVSSLVLWVLAKVPDMSSVLWIIFVVAALVAIVPTVLVQKAMNFSNSKLRPNQRKPRKRTVVGTLVEGLFIAGPIVVAVIYGFYFSSVPVSSIPSSIHIQNADKTFAADSLSAVKKNDNKSASQTSKNATPSGKTASATSASASVTSNGPDSTPAADPAITPTNDAAASTLPDSGWQTYSSQTYGFSLSHPAAWIASESVSGAPPTTGSEVFGAFFGYNTGQRYGEAAIFRVYAGDFDTLVKAQDNAYAAQAATTVVKTTAPFKGRDSVQYTATASTGEKTKLVFFDTGGNTYSITSDHEQLNLGRDPNYWTDFDQLLNSITIQ